MKFKIVTGFIARQDESLSCHLLELFLAKYQRVAPIVIHDCSDDKTILPKVLSRAGADYVEVSPFRKAQLFEAMEAPTWDHAIRKWNGDLLFLTHIDNVPNDPEVLAEYVRAMKREQLVICGHWDMIPPTPDQLSLPRISPVACMVRTELWNRFWLSWENSNMLVRNSELQIFYGYKMDVGALATAKMMQLQRALGRQLVNVYPTHWYAGRFRHYWMLGGLENVDNSLWFRDKKREPIIEHWKLFQADYRKTMGRRERLQDPLA